MERTVNEELMRLYSEIGAKIDKTLADQPVTCRKGCAGCCHQLVEIGMSEGLLIASEVASWPDIWDWIERLFRAAKKMVAPEVTKASHFDQEIPCVFLQGDHLCAIYKVRPAACRFYFVRSPSKNCFPGAIDTTTESYVIGREALSYIVGLDRHLVLDNPCLGPQAGGLLPHMVLWALGKTAQNRGDRRNLEKKLSKMLTIQEWTARERLSRKSDAHQ